MDFSIPAMSLIPFVLNLYFFLIWYLLQLQADYSLGTELFGHNDHNVMFKEHKPLNTISIVKRGGGSITCGWQEGPVHEEGILCGYIRGTPQDISQEVNTWVQKGLPNGQWPKGYFLTTKTRYRGGRSKALNHNPLVNLWADLERWPLNLTQLHQFCR